MANKQCVACRQSFETRPQVPGQTYCSSPDCQRARRRQWQQGKLKRDQDYRDNQARAQGAWRQRNPDYWRAYRESHPEYVDSNRAQQRDRDAKARIGRLAKMDASNSDASLASGLYQLIPVADSDLAKMDVWIVEITVRGRQSLPRVDLAKR